MNTNTPTSSVLPATVSNPILTSAEQEVANLRAQLEAAEQHRANLVREEAETRAKARREAILALPVTLGVDGLPEVIALIRREMSPAPVGKRGFPTALSPDTLTQMRAMLEAGATSRAVAEALKVGISTVDARKAKWGLTRRATTKAPTAPRKSRQSYSGHHISPAKRAQIVEALKRPNARVAVVARRAGVSRQSIYSIRATVPELMAA